MGFYLIGFLIGFLIILPSIVFIIKFPPKNVPKEIDKINNFFTLLEKIGQISCLTILIISKENFQNLNFNILFVLIIVLIFIYYLLWIRYVVKGQDYYLLVKPFLFIPIPLAILPVCVFFITSIMTKSIFLGIATICLTIGHITISWKNYKLTK